MNPRLARFVLSAFAGLLLFTSGAAETKTTDPVAASQQRLEIPFEYKCNGERVVVQRCFSEADDAYCSVQYPDRKGAKTNWLTPELAEQRGELIKKLQACGALAASQPAGTPTVNSGGRSSSSPAETNRELGNRAYDEGISFATSRNYTAARQSFRKAIEHYKAAIALDPKSIAYYRLGDAYFRLNEYQAALSAWKEFRALKPDTVHVLYQMSAAHRGLKQYDQAMTLVREGIRLKPDKIALQSFYGELGDIYFELKEYEKALLAYQEAARLVPAVTRYREMGDAYYELRRYPEAAEAYTRATASWVNDADAYYGLGLTYLRMGRKGDALIIHEYLSKLDKARAATLLAEIQKTN